MCSVIFVQFIAQIVPTDIIKRATNCYIIPGIKKRGVDTSLNEDECRFLVHDIFPHHLLMQWADFGTNANVNAQTLTRISKQSADIKVRFFEVLRQLDVTKALIYNTLLRTNNTFAEDFNKEYM